LSFIRHTLTLIKKEALLELRNKYALAGLLLYVFSTIFVLYLALSNQGAAKNIEVKYWNVLFWIVMLFSSINTITKSFVHENSNRYLYYYALVSPTLIITAKMIYNVLLMLVISSLSLLLFVIVLGTPIQNFQLFFVVILLGAVAFSFLFTLLSSIATKAGNASLTAILGLPLIVILILYLMRLSRECFFITHSENLMINLMILTLFNLVLFILSLILFPYLWRD
jgi:heme exporter protein B